ncbi:MAG: alanine racemase [Clostridia bacterium]|nr:alanine racemase [Clostridia bacterium]
MYRNTFVEVDTSVMQNNVKNIIKKYNEYEWYIGVVKGNAYGHGMEIVKYITKAGINYLAVSSLEEAVEVRKYDKKTPVLCLEPIQTKYINECVKNNVTMTIHSYEYYKELINLKLDDKIKVHLKLDTGMNRLGVTKEQEVTEIVKTLLGQDNIELEGIYSHLGTTGVYDKEWDNQVSKFEKLTQGIDLNKIKIVHIARGISIINHGKIKNTNGVRLGITMYGYTNSFLPNNKGLKNKLRNLKVEMLKKKLNISPTVVDNNPDVVPAFKLKSEVIQIKDVKKGECVGYGAMYRAPEDIKVAVLPIGYADGLDIRNTGRDIEINGNLYPIIGTVNMGMITVKVNEKVKVGDIANIIGGKVDAKYIADYLKVTRYVLVTSVAKDIPRVYIKSEE